jgi:hypothetical protein
MSIWKCCVFAGKHGQKGQSHNKFKEANEEFRSYSTARRNHLQRWQGPRCYDGSSLRTKTWCSDLMQEDPLSWSRGWWPQNDTNEWVHVQNAKMSREEKDGPEPAQKRPRPTGLVESSQGFLWRFGSPFDLVTPRSISSSSLLWQLPYPIILPMPFTRKLPPQDDGESWMSSSQGSTPVEERKQEEDSKPLA